MKAETSVLVTIKTESESRSKGNNTVPSLKKKTFWQKSKMTSSKVSPRRPRSIASNEAQLDLEEHIFYYNKGTDAKYPTSKDRLLT